MSANLKKISGWRLFLLAGGCFGLLDAAVSGEIAATSKVQAAPVIMGVASFGMPGEQKYIFCDRPECPDRTQKNIYVPPPPPPLRMPDPVVAVPHLAPPVTAIADAPKNSAKKTRKHKKKKRSSTPKKRPAEKLSCPAIDK